MLVETMLRRLRMSSKTISVFLESSGLFAPTKSGGDTGAGVTCGFGEVCGDGETVGDGDGVTVCGGVLSFGFSCLKRSRKESSRNFGVRSFKSILANCPFSVLCEVSNKINAPSALHETEFALEFARKLTGRAAPPLIEATEMLT